jgi:hypothetical protein
VCLEGSTKPPIYNFIHEFLIEMAFTMACPDFKKGLKMAFGPLGDFSSSCYKKGKFIRIYNNSKNHVFPISHSPIFFGVFFIVNFIPNLMKIR